MVLKFAFELSLDEPRVANKVTSFKMLFFIKVRSIDFHLETLCAFSLHKFLDHWSVLLCVSLSLLFHHKWAGLALFAGVGGEGERGSIHAPPFALFFS